MTNSSIDQTEAYYQAIEEDRKNGVSAKSKPSGHFVTVVVWFVAAVVASSIALFCVSTLAEKSMDSMTGTFVTDCKNGDKYSGKVPASYDGDIFAYAKDNPSGNVVVMEGGCMQVAHGND